MKKPVTSLRSVQSMGRTLPLPNIVSRWNVSVHAKLRLKIYRKLYRKRSNNIIFNKTRSSPAGGANRNAHHQPRKLLQTFCVSFVVSLLQIVTKIRQPCLINVPLCGIRLYLAEYWKQLVMSYAALLYLEDCVLDDVRAKCVCSTSNLSCRALQFVNCWCYQRLLGRRCYSIGCPFPSLCLSSVVCRVVYCGQTVQDRPIVCIEVE